MSASSKFDISSSSPDRPLYASGHRGSYGGASLDRCAQGDVLPNMSRSSSSVTQGDVLNFFQCVRVDPKSIVVDHKLNRSAEFKRLASSAVGIPLEDTLPASSKGKQLSTPSPEDLRRLKSSVRESGTKARERVKIFNDCLSVANKCFPTVPSRKRSQLDALSNDRSNTLMSIDRSASGVCHGKMGLQNHTSTGGFELERQNSDERTNNPIPSKRSRTSMMDVRTNNITRPSHSVDKDRDIARLSNSSAVQGDNLCLSVAPIGWEKSKMKKKRTVIKPGAAANSMMTKSVDGYREPKQEWHLRLPTEASSRLIDTHGFRSGTNGGGQGVGKAETTPQTSSGMHSSVSRTDSDGTSALHERRERPIGQKKERVNLKSVNKANSREDFRSDTTTAGPKWSANGRASRPGLVSGVSNLSQVVQRPTSSNDWEVSNCTSKIPGGLGANSHERTPSAVGSWVQKQKVSRTARRANLLPIVPCSGENPAVDATSDMMAERCFPVNSPQQVKIRSDTFSPAALSESEESGAAEIKSRDKNKKCDNVDEKSCQNIQKMSTLRKNKTLNGDDHGDDIRRQGRTARGFISSSPPLPLSLENQGNVGTSRQVRSSRLGHGKTESRVGRPPTRRLSDRKASTRKKHNAISAGADFVGGSDDDREELLAASNAVTNAAKVPTSAPFLKAEASLRFISDMDLSKLKDQVNLVSALDMPAPAPLDAGNGTLAPNGRGSNEFGREEIEKRSVEPSPEDLAPGANSLNAIPMYQRLLAALIHEEGNQGLGFCGKEDLEYCVYGSRLDMEKDVEPDILCSQISPNCVDRNLAPIPGTGIPSYDHFDHLEFGLRIDKSIPGTECSENQYCSLSLDERILMEINSIGIYPDLVSGEDEVDEDISRWQEKHREKASMNKGPLDKLLSSASEAKELQEKEFGERALDELVQTTYKKYTTASGKMTKQSASALFNRTMKRYQEFKTTGKTCFDDPLYMDTFLSGVTRLADEEKMNYYTDDDSTKLPEYASANPGSEGNEDISNRVKRKELSLNDVGGTSSAKGKRSERGRYGNGKGKGRDVLPKSGTMNKGPRKPKSKPKQKTTHLPTQVKEGFSLSLKSNEIAKDRNGNSVEVLEDPIDLSGLELPGMDDLGVSGGIVGQGEDIGTWFGVEDDDFMDGLVIPMDDLSDVNMIL